MSVAMHGTLRSRQASLGLIVPSAAPFVESVNFTLPIGPTKKPGRTLAVIVVDPKGPTTLGAAVSVVVVGIRKSLATAGAATAPSPATASTAVVVTSTSRRPARVRCPRIISPLPRPVAENHVQLPDPGPRGPVLRHPVWADQAAKCPTYRVSRALWSFSSLSPIADRLQCSSSYRPKSSGMGIHSTTRSCLQCRQQRPGQGAAVATCQGRNDVQSR